MYFNIFNMNTYKPIDCAIYDILEIAAMRGTLAEISYKNALGETLEINERIKAVFTRDKAEYIKLYNSLEIRLDYLVRIAFDGNVIEFEEGGSCSI